MNGLIKKTQSFARISRINENYIYYILGVSKKKEIYVLKCLEAPNSKKNVILHPGLCFQPDLNRI